jgi:hypothetical protein
VSDARLFPEFATAAAAKLWKWNTRIQSFSHLTTALFGSLSITAYAGNSMALRRLRSRIRSFDGCNANFRASLRICKNQTGSSKQEDSTGELFMAR